MTTALDIISDALEALGVYDPGDSISAADESRSLFVLNAMIDQWAGQNIFVYSTAALNVTLLVGVAQYTISDSGSPSVTAPRPDRIAYGPGVASVKVSNITTPVDVVSAIEFRCKQAYGNTPATPDTLWYNPTYPRGTLNILPTPNVGGTLTFTAWQRLFSFNASTSVTLAVGMLDALRDNLAVEVKPYFTDAQINPITAQAAVISKDFLRFQSLNSRASMGRFTLASNPRKPD